MALTLGIVPAELPYHLNRLNSRNTLRTNMPWFAVDVDCLHAAGVAADHRRREIRRHSRVWFPLLLNPSLAPFTRWSYKPLVIADDQRSSAPCCHHHPPV